MSDEERSVNEEAPEEEEEKKDEEDKEYQISFASYQLFLFVTCYLGYTIMLYNRKAFTFTLPHVIMEEYYSSYEVGMILAAQSFMYTISRFIMSWASDHFPVKIMFAGGMFLTGFVMLAFSDQEDWHNIMLLTGANGLAQGLGWPAVTKMIRAWYPPTQFGFWFACLSTASNLIGTVGPGIATALAVTHGWRLALQIPAVLALIASAVIPFCCWDKPSDVGYEDQLTLGGNEGHWSDLAGSDFMMLLATCVSLIFIVKTTCQDWGQMYLLQERGLSAFSASSYLAAMEVGGICGSILMGALSDFMIRRGYYFGTGKSPRMIVVQLLVAGACLFLNLFLFTIDPDTEKFYMSALGFMMGFCMYGALSLLSVIALEVAPINMTGMAHGIIGMAATFGVMTAGIPISYIADCFDWFTAFMMINLVCVAVFFILNVGKNIKASFLQQGGGPPKLAKKAE